jgi:putative flippase GtrA
MIWRFLLVGGTGFVIDATVTYLLTRLWGMPLVARVPGIGTAMIFTWLANRYFTYRVNTRKTKAEAFRYATTVWLMSLVNWSVYAVLIRVGIPSILAVVCSTGGLAIVSFHAYRHWVFRVPR